MNISPKQLRLLGVGTGFLLVVALSALAGCGSQTNGQTQPTVRTIPATASPAHTAGAVITTPIVGVTMFSAGMGWGGVLNTSSPTTTQGIAATTDGGHTWYNVTPSGLTLVSPFTIALYPRSAEEAWTWLSQYAGGSSTTLWHTTDGGAHWSSHTVSTGAVGQLDFVDSLHGWLTATPFGAAAGLYPINVWRTTDGGATWAQVGSYSVVGGTSGISFANTTTGYANGCPLGGPSGSPLTLCVTHDGASTWSALTSPTLPGYVQGNPILAQLPVFTSATAGILEVSMAAGSSGPVTLYPYHTADGGASWQQDPALSGPTGSNFGMTRFLGSVLSTGEVVVAVSVSGQATLYQLLPGATSWTKIATGGSSVALLSGLTQLDFVNSTSGWAVTKSGLVGTTDGGVTWTVLHA